MEFTYEKAIESEVFNMVLTRIDRNGTKIYTGLIKCFKCNGTGYLPEFNHVQAGVCFDCNGTCTQEVTVKKMTEEYAKKLEARRIARENKKKNEYLNSFYANNGFNVDGKTYIVLGDTYAIKDELKKIGGKYSSNLGWHISEKNDSYKTFEVDIWEVYDKEIFDKEKEYVEKDYVDVRSRAEKLTNEMNAANSNSKHVNSVGEKIEIVGTIKSYEEYSYKVAYNSYNNVTRVTIEDVNGVIYVWGATNNPFTEEELNGKKTIMLRGTVKELVTNKGVPNTILTRCKKI